MRGVIRCVTITIGCVLRGAMRGAFFAARRLRELPDFGEGNPALRRAGRMSGRIYWERAAGCWGTRIVDRPVNNLASGSGLPNIFRSNNIVVIFSGNA